MSRPKGLKKDGHYRYRDLLIEGTSYYEVDHGEWRVDFEDGRPSRLVGHLAEAVKRGRASVAATGH